MPYLHPFSLSLSLLILLFAPLVSCALVNRTIDDEFGDCVTGEKPLYYPPGSATWSQGKDCKTCLFHPDSSRAFNGTWHDASQHPNDPEVRTITAHFTGTAVYVYNAIAAYLYGPGLKNHTVAYMTFELDGAPVGEFFENNINGGVTYGVPVYANGSITDGAHTLVIRVPPGPTGSDWSFVLFDYIVYTTNDDASPSPPPSSSSSTPPGTTSTATNPSLTLNPLTSPAPATSPNSSYTITTATSNTSTSSTETRTDGAVAPSTTGGGSVLMHSGAMWGSIAGCIFVCLALIAL